MWGVPPRRWEDDAPDQLLMNQQALGRLEQALLALPPNHRVVVTLRDIDGPGCPDAEPVGPRSA